MNSTLKIIKVAITISPPCRLSNYKRYKDPQDLVFNNDLVSIYSILSYNRIYKFIIYPEFDFKGRLHYHGIISLDSNQKVRFYKHALIKLKNIGFVEIKPLKTFLDNLKWLIYCSKEWGITRDILNIKNPLSFIIVGSDGIAGENIRNTRHRKDKIGTLVSKENRVAIFIDSLNCMNNIEGTGPCSDLDNNLVPLSGINKFVINSE